MVVVDLVFMCVEEELDFALRFYAKAFEGIDSDGPFLVMGLGLVIVLEDSGNGVF